MSEKAAALKAEGNAFLKTKSYPEAVQKYTEVHEYCRTVDINLMCVYVLRFRTANAFERPHPFRAATFCAR